MSTNPIGKSGVGVKEEGAQPPAFLFLKRKNDWMRCRAMSGDVGRSRPKSGDVGRHLYYTILYYTLLYSSLLLLIL